MNQELSELRDRPFDLLVAMSSVLKGGTPGQEQSDGSVWTSLAFRVGDQKLLCPKQEVRELIVPPPCTRVPATKSWLLGVANVRGELLPVIDLSAILGGPPASVQPESRVLVYQSRYTPAGFLVDEVYGFRQHGMADQRHDDINRAKDRFRPCLLGAFIHEGQVWPVFSLGKLVHDDSFLDVVSV